MQRRNLGRSGLRVSAVGLGCNNFGGRLDLDATRAVIHKAFDVGVTLFDTADVYGERGGSETLMGEVLGDTRKRIVLATKFGMPMDDSGEMQGGSRRYVFAAIDASLRRLKTDWIDLYQLHRPDPHTPIEETLRALEDLSRAGKIRYYGCSNMPAWQVVEAQWTAKSLGLAGFVSCQDEYSLLVREADRDLMPAMRQYGLGLLPYFPLASGLLTGKYRRNRPMPKQSRLTETQRLADRYLTEKNWSMSEKLIDLAEANGMSPLDLAIGWLLARDPVASVIAGATKPAQIEQNAAASDVALPPDLLAEIDGLA